MNANDNIEIGWIKVDQRDEKSLIRFLVLDELASDALEMIPVLEVIFWCFVVLKSCGESKYDLSSKT